MIRFHCPFKGAHSWEMQIGLIVIQIRHRDRDPIWNPRPLATVWLDRY